MILDISLLAFDEGCDTECRNMVKWAWWLHVAAVLDLPVLCFT